MAQAAAHSKAVVLLSLADLLLPFQLCGSWCFILVVWCTMQLSAVCDCGIS